MIRTTVFLSKAQYDGLAEAAKADPAGLKSSHLIRRFISEGLARVKKQAATAAKG
jgi:hypothetical protein